MLWALAAFVASISWATADLISKHLMNHLGESRYHTLWARFVASNLPMGVALYIEGIPHIAPDFWWAYPTVIVGDTLASIFYITALEEAPISLTVPLLSSAPLFMLVTSSVILREFPSLRGSLGVILVVTGAYLLNLHLAKGGILLPLKELVRSRASRLVLAAAFIFSIDTAFGKIVLQSSNVSFFGLTYCLGMGIAMLPVLLFKTSKIPLKKMARPPFLALGVLFGLGIICFLYAMGQTNIAYVSGVGRLSMVIAVLYGKFFFNEQHISQRMVGSLVILCGVVLILLH